MAIKLNYPQFEDSIRGMISKRDVLTENDKFYFVRRNKKKIILFPKLAKDISMKDVLGQEEVLKNYEMICFQYVPQEMFVDGNFKSYMGKKYDISSKFSLMSLMSLFEPSYFDLCGKENREVRETRNKLDRLVNEDKSIVVVDPSKSSCFDYKQLSIDVNKMIDKWNWEDGLKYGRINHSGYDKNFFENYYPKHHEDFYSLFFYDNTQNLIGYSVISKKPLTYSDVPCYSYLIRKCKTSFVRNLTLYIDFCIFRHIHEDIGVDKAFGIHWGASKGNLLTYKKKFPIMDESKILFYTMKSKDLF